MAIERNKHWINHLPHIYEVDDLLSFCGRYAKLYIYGCTEEQECITKFLDMCGVSITGYVVKMSHIERMKENMDVFGFDLSVEEMMQISNLESGKRLGANPDNFDF